MWTVAVVQETGWSGLGGGQLRPGAAGQECPPGDVTAPESAERQQGPGGGGGGASHTNVHCARLSAGP